MSETGHNDLELPERGKRPSNPFLSIGNEVFDLFLPIMGADCFAVYAYFVRRHHSDRTLKHDLRNLADSCGLSVTTASRACEVLEHLRLLRLRRFKGSRQSQCQLFDSGAVAKRLSAEYDSKSKSYRFPAQVSRQLHSEVCAIRERQQGHGRAIGEARNNSGNLPLRVSQRNTSVPSEKRQCSTRETPAGTHLIRKEERLDKTPSPTPSPDGAAQTEETDPDEDEPDGLLRWAQTRFNGVIDDMRDHLLDTNTPPSPRFRNGYEEWQEFGFAHMAVEAGEFCGGVLVLTISAPDPGKARRGLDKYRRTWDESVRKWYQGEVRVQLVEASRKA